MTETERLPGVPSALWKYPLFSSRGKGACQTLAGRVRLTFLFTDIPGYHWSFREKQEAKELHAQAMKLVARDARRFGIPLELRTDYISSSVNEEVTMGNSIAWADKALAGAQMPGYSDAGALLKKRFGVDSTPICFCINGPGRSFAQCDGATEFVVLFSQNSLFHELCHLYGASDFYFPEKLSELVNTYYPNSIMRGSSTENPEVDGFTAYLMGWTDKLMGRDQQFLKELEKIPLSDFTEAVQTEHFTGDATNLRTRSGIYTGPMVDGQPHGRGKYVYNSGAIYEGEFVRGEYHGQGVYTDKEKNRRIGTFVRDKLEGEAKIIYADGGRFQGRFENDVREGFGTMMWEDGSRYSGDYRDGQRTGYGTYFWPDGTYYEGEFLNGQCHGLGTKTQPDGTSYEGQYRNGNSHGKGVYRFPDGAYYDGQFQEGKFHGYGEHHYSDGGVYKGEYVNDKRSGKGIFLWPDGTRYEGQFLNSYFHGKGIYRFPDGSFYDGQFQDGKFHGYGEHHYADGRRFKGDYVCGKRSGKGILIWPDGNRFEGEFRDGLKHGYGTYTFPDGSKKTGRWENDNFMG